MAENNPARNPDESFDEYVLRRSRENLDFRKHMQGKPIAPAMANGNKLVKIVSNKRQAKKKAMAALGIKSGKKFRRMMKKEKYKNAKNS